ncbi:type I-E CRISPR-associated protein Cas6/Cse3/CasE [Embleya sp. NPDC005575]|uniref:type I-E CRISPR-associated protein Cas6/Cse3/CasE n=1 Tax=Embleya sp. NPDC005575 TaxID=3156892 RepID=UPI0033B0A00F
MPYLSRVRLNPLRGESRKLLANPRAMHGAVLGGIADRPTGERVLWRLDTDNPRRPMLFALTESRPDWTHVVERAGWPDAEGEHAAVRDYAPLLARIATGREFAFRLTANPVQNTSAPKAPSAIQDKRKSEVHVRSFRIGHRTAADQLTWFLKRTEGWGFAVPEARTDPAVPGIGPLEGAVPAREVRITARHRQSFGKGGRGAPPVVLNTATFEGRLRVTDAGLFTQRLLGGLGPGKAYGCGLLTLAALPEGP